MRQFRRTGCVVALVVGALAVPATASAGIFSDTVHHSETLTNTFTQPNGTTAFEFVFSELAAKTNTQQVIGTLSNGAVVGTAIYHQWSKGPGPDHGYYEITGFFDPTGASPPVPFSATVTATYERTRNVSEGTLDGDVGGQPIGGSTGTIVNPLYGAFGGALAG